MANIRRYATTVPEATRRSLPAGWWERLACALRYGRIGRSSDPIVPKYVHWPEGSGESIKLFLKGDPLALLQQGIPGAIEITSRSNVFDADQSVLKVTREVKDGELLKASAVSEVTRLLSQVISWNEEKNIYRAKFFLDGWGGRETGRPSRYASTPYGVVTTTSRHPLASSALMARRGFPCPVTTNGFHRLTKT